MCSQHEETVDHIVSGCESSMIKRVLGQPNFSPQTNATQLFPKINTNFNNLSSVKVNTNISSCVKLDEWDKFEFSVKKEGKF